MVRKTNTNVQCPLVQSWDVAKDMIANMLHEQGGMVHLANVKRIFRTRFNLELSHIKLGHANISDMLRDPQLKDVCRLAPGDIVVQVTTPLPSDACSPSAATADEGSFEIESPRGVQSAATRPAHLNSSTGAAAPIISPVQVEAGYAGCRGELLPDEDHSQMVFAQDDSQPLWLVQTQRTEQGEARLWSKRDEGRTTAAGPLVPSQAGGNNDGISSSSHRSSFDYVDSFAGSAYLSNQLAVNGEFHHFDWSPGPAFSWFST